jgi:hypothetical protein
MSCSSSDENYNAGCDVAVIDFSTELAKTILGRRKLLLELTEKDRCLQLLNYANSCAEFWRMGLYSNHDIDEPVPLKEGVKGEPQRVDNVQMIITSTWVWWEAHPRHTEITISSPPIKYSWIEEQIK